MSRSIDAVLPLRARDLPRARLLAASLRRFCKGIGTLWLVASDEALPEAERIFADVAPCEAVPEREVVPELRSWRARLWPQWVGAARPGYRGQQLIKLGMSERVRSDFYLTLDADVLAVAPIDADWLVPGGKARTVRDDGGAHRNWYAAASEILGVPASPWEHGVTPCVLSRACVRSLLAYMEQSPSRARPVVTSEPTVSGAWRGPLMRRHDWTEYTLYHTFVEAAGADAEYHQPIPRDAWYSANVWVAQDWASWSPEAAFGGNGSFRFCVLQSSAIPDAADVERAVRRYLER